MSWWRSDELDVLREIYPGLEGDEWKMGVGPLKANFGHSVMGTGGAIHFDHRGNQLPTYRHTPRLLNLINNASTAGETITQRDVDEYRRARDAGVSSDRSDWVHRQIKYAVDNYNETPDYFLENYPPGEARDKKVALRKMFYRRGASGGEVMGSAGTFTNFLRNGDLAGRFYLLRGYRPNED